MRGEEKGKKTTRTVSAVLPSTKEEEEEEEEKKTNTKNVRNKLLSDPYFYRPGFNRAGPGPGAEAAAKAVSKG